MTTWQQIIGHDWAVELLANSIRHDRVGHAYLITGLEQVGKTTLARAFAQALNCLAEDVSERENLRQRMQASPAGQVTPLRVVRAPEGNG